MKVEDISKPVDQLVKLRLEDLMKVPELKDEPPLTEPKEEWKRDYITDLDGYIAIDLPIKPKTEEEKRRIVERFLEGFKKLLDKESNWTFLQ